MIQKPTYLLLFTIGPVQSFIAQARKTQDLYAGSVLLSDLVKFVMDEIEKDKHNIVYPGTSGGANPNRFIAKITVADDAAMRQYADVLAENVKNEFMRIAKKYLDLGNWDACEKQLNGFLEVHWAAILYSGEANYGKDYLALEQQLGAAKNYRPFVQLAEQGRKCSVTGTQNALFYRKNEGKSEAAYLCSNCSVVRHDETQNIQHTHLQAGEGISAIVMLKRRYDKISFEFPSTADIAMMNLMPELDTKLLAVGELATILKVKKENIGHFWFEENYNLENFKKEGYNKEDFEKAEKEWKKIKTFIGEAKDRFKFHKYYAILLFDADDMGAKIGGLDEIEQGNLSKKLSAYAEYAKKYVEGENRGKVVYAGGDDFLGMLTLPTLFETMQKLREEFDTRVGFGLKFSAGVAIAHYKTPLAETLNWARKMEHQAKTVEGKDAYAIAAVRHSGEVTTTILKWKKDDAGDYSDTNMTTSAVSSIYEQLRNNFSSKWIMLLQNEAAIFEGAANAGIEQNMLKHELERLIARACKLNDKDEKKKAVKILTDNSTALLEMTWRVSEKNIAPLINTLAIADFSNRKLND